jgi:ATP-dependent exoDNAse (exonuclease V) beta subunit
VINLDHQAISASAGSGKTFQLAHRYIRLMALGVPPERMIALTFSRKAAGEIFDAIAQHLHRAASSDKGAEATAKFIGQAGMGRTGFLALLRTFLNSLARLHISTLDSFTVGVVRAFPMELGVGTEFDIMDNAGDAAQGARQEALSELFSPRHGVDRKAQAAFREAFKQATFGAEEKTLKRSLDTFLDGYQTFYHALPDEEAWGHPATIWPAGSPWLGHAVDVMKTGDQLLDSLERSGQEASVLERWRVFVTAAQGFTHESPWPDDVDYLLKKLLPEVDALRDGAVTLKLDRKACRLSSEECRLALDLVSHLVALEFNRAQEMTRGVFRILDQYEELYDAHIRRRGRLTFDDAQYLLTPQNPLSRGSVLSRRVDADARLYIDYRLNSSLDHWMLDEFQDTSDLQWAVLGNLADEVLQDDSGTRSFFFVGDVKQAIYGWRGGNASLFRAVQTKYRAVLKESLLSTSFRSCRPVIDAVNRTFSGLPSGLDLPEQTVSDWAAIWDDHRPDAGVADKPGCAMLVEPPRPDKGNPSPEDRYLAVAALLKEIDPLARGLSVAVLVRSNRAGAEVVDVLRGECPGIPIAHEGHASIVDNPVVAALLALVQYAVHPGDTLAWRHVAMSPLHAALRKEGLSRKTLPTAVLRRFQAHGFGPLVRHWGGRLGEQVSLDAFGLGRLRDLTDAAEAYDQRGGRDGNEFIRFVEEYTLRESAADHAVRVMTIHQSKGLGFDIVILPELQGGSMKGAGAVPFAVARDKATGDPRWALKMPRRMLAEADPVLAAEVEAADEKASFESLCVLYVAMTRAKRGLYMVTSFPGKNSTASDAARLLKEQLWPSQVAEDITLDGQSYDLLYLAGDADWFRTVEPAAGTGGEAAVPGLATAYGQRPSRRRRLSRVTPSGSGGEEEGAALLFGPGLQAAFGLGTAVHELFERIEWLDEADLDQVVDDWRGTTTADPALQESAVEHFRRAAGGEAFRAALARPGGEAELWRERSFEVVLGDEWVTGTFDRVVVGRDGGAVRATVLDFKTNDVPTGEAVRKTVEHYRPQMELYARALGYLLDLDPADVRLRLLFTGRGEVVEVGR